MVIFYEVNGYWEINVVSYLFTGQDLRQVNLSAEYVYYHETSKYVSNEISLDPQASSNIDTMKKH